MLTVSPASPSAPAANISRKGLVLRDSLTFLTLFAATAALYGVTLFLFRSFESHRHELGIRWSERGSVAMQHGHPDQAVAALRAALTYAPDNRSYQLLLAQALAASGRTEEATNYFLNLWDTRPGDGFINLQLARLTRRKGEPSQAIEYYRAAIFGAWQESGILHRRNVRLELADYLIERHDLPAARSELLIAAGNSPDDPKFTLVYAGKLAATGDLVDSLNFDRKAIAHNPADRVALEAAGRAAFSLGDYPAAHGYLRQALALPKPPGSAEEKPGQLDLATLDHNAVRLVELNLSRNLPARELGQHLLLASGIAEARLAACSASLPAPAPTGTAPSPLADLVARWKLAGTRQNRRAILSDGDLQDQRIALIFSTERVTASLCGHPAGDDALLLQLANADTRTAAQLGSERQ